MPERSKEALEEAYKRLEGSPLAERPPVPEPVKRTKKDPWVVAKRASEDLFRSIPIVGMSHSLEPEEIIYAVELMAVTTFNAVDCPLSPAKVNEIRQKADDYYFDNIDKVPDLRKVKKR
jgi:hypothetical protein